MENIDEIEPELKNRLDNIVDFLEWYRPGGPWVISAIVPDGKIATETFTPDRIDVMRDWLGPRLESENIHFHVNNTGDVWLHKKASKSDIKAVEFFQVDMDCQTEFVEAEKRKMFDQLMNYHAPPSLIIDSGNGLQGFWRLSESIQSDDWSGAEAYNRQLEYDFNGDHCHDVSRIMRMPFTWNNPNKKKRSKGRQRVETSIIHQTDAVYSLDVFKPAPMIDGGNDGDLGRVPTELTGNFETIGGIEDLDEWNVSWECKQAIVNGQKIADDNKPFESRSEAVWYVTCELVRCGVPDDTIAGILLDHDLGISAHVYDQKNPQGYVVRQIQRAHEHAVNPALTEFNDRYFATKVGGKFRIGEDVGGELEFMLDETFTKLYQNKFVEYADAEGNLKKIPKGKWWLTHPKRREYLSGVRFDPTGKIIPGSYNMWQGFAVVPKPGDRHHSLLQRTSMTTSVRATKSTILI